jgi:hypothetical protein
MEFKMKISKRRLKKLIREARMAQGGFMPLRSRADPEFAALIKGQRKLSEYNLDPMEHVYKKVVTDYETWVQEMGHITPAASSVLATYLIDQGLDKDTERTGILTSEYKMDKTDVARELEAQFAEAEAGIVDDAESFRRGFYEGNKMKITKRQLRRLIKEEKAKLLSEQDHEMYAEDDELRELGEAIENLSHWSMETNRLMDRMAERYGELVAKVTSTVQIANATEELANSFDAALDDIVRFR